MEIKLIETGKKDFLDLLLLADESESMIDQYLERGALYALYDGDLKSVCVVTDEGGGLKLEDEGRIFERYYTNRKQNGDSGSTGLGLHISRLIIELHGGAIRAGNVKSGPGAEFVIQLPAR